MQREDVADVVVDDEELGAFDPAVSAVRCGPRCRVAGWSDVGQLGARQDRHRLTLRWRRVDANGCRDCRPTRGQVDREGAALARDAGHRDLAAEQADQLPADREAETRPAVEAGGGAVALGELLEDPALLFVVDPDPRVSDGHGHDRRRAGELVRVAAPSFRGQPNPHVHDAFVGELEGVGDQVLEDLA